MTIVGYLAVGTVHHVPAARMRNAARHHQTFDHASPSNLQLAAASARGAQRYLRTADVIEVTPTVSAG